MHEVNVDLLRKEAQRLLREEIKLLENIKNAPNVLEEAGGNRQTLDTKSLPEAIERLQGEEYKLNNLELVVAVVGTMKAGKSTTINAIVGMEVLPNRNRPMTALPTLIRHTAGVKIPRLIFDNTAPVNELIEKLANILPTVSKIILDQISENDDMKQLLYQVNGRQPFSKKHEGSEAIFNFLKGLNDLVRLSTDLGVKFPFDAYSQMENLPVIEVEFTHLSEMGHVQGRLTLLDTPGPNEAGQNHLRPMLRNQLEKASAVLAVLDYTQLKSDADNEIRKNLEGIAKVTGDRLYVLVNKFDEKDRNGDDEKTVCKYIAGNLMKGQVPPNRVYPVSSKLGYLASQAKNELTNNGKLPDYKTHSWVKDFAQESIGRRWEKKIEDIEEVNEAANDLWEDSLFNAPLEDVIVHSYKKAALLAIDSAASKMIDLTGNIKNFIGTRKQAFNKSVNEIQKQVVALQFDIDKIKEEENAVSEDAKNALDDVKKGIQSAGKNIQKETLSILNEYFKEGKAIEAKERAKEKKTSKKKNEQQGPLNIFSAILGGVGGNTNKEELDFSPDEKIIKLESKNDAKQLLDSIGESLEIALKGAEENLQKNIELKIEVFNKSFSNCVIKAEQLIKNIQQDMHDFDLVIRLPDVRKVKINLPISDLLDDAAQETTETRTRERRQSGLWGGICSIFDTSNWGWETYSESVKFYIVDIEKTKEDVNIAIKKAFVKMEELAGTTVQADLSEQTDAFFSILREKVEYIRGDLIANINDRKKSQEEQESLVSNLSKLENPASHLLKDSEELGKDIKDLLYKAGEI